MCACTPSAGDDHLTVVFGVPDITDDAEIGVTIPGLQFGTGDGVGGAVLHRIELSVPFEPPEDSLDTAGTLVFRHVGGIDGDR